MTIQNPLASPPPIDVGGLAHPEDPADGADPGQDHRHAGQPLHDHGQAVVDLGQVHVERARRKLAVVVELVGQPDRVVVHVAEVEDLVGVDELEVTVRELVEHLSCSRGLAADLDELTLDQEERVERLLRGAATSTASWMSSIVSPTRSTYGKYPSTMSSQIAHSR